VAFFGCDPDLIIAFDELCALGQIPVSRGL
jgi:hypothetical protein